MRRFAFAEYPVAASDRQVPGHLSNDRLPANRDVNAIVWSWPAAGVAAIRLSGR